MNKTLFDGMLPKPAVIVETGLQAWGGGLWPAELDVAKNFSAQRLREFCAGRNALRKALGILGRPPAAVLVGPGREPLLPEGVVGSLTHTNEYCAAAVVDARHGLSIGLDAEAAGALEPGVAALILNVAERVQVDRLRDEFGDQSWERLIFSAKESFQKALYRCRPLLLDFLDIELAIHPSHGHFSLAASRLSNLQPLLQRSCRGHFYAPRATPGRMAA